MKSRMHKLMIRGMADGNVILLDSTKYYTILILSVCRVLHEEYGFGPDRLNRLTEALADFMNREDANTLGDELTYWAEKRGIKF